MLPLIHLEGCGPHGSPVHTLCSLVTRVQICYVTLGSFYHYRHTLVVRSLLTVSSQRAILLLAQPWGPGIARLCGI